MKKIGILTFHRAINYGAYLQSFSLSQRLQAEFPECKVEIIDYIAPIEAKKIPWFILSAGYHYGIKKAIFEIKKCKSFRKALVHLPLSPKYMNTENINEVFEYIDNRYDVIIAGSDAIFNWNQNGFPSAFFLNYNFKSPILSYAGSVHGLKYKLMSELQKQYCEESFNRFSFIGVRDKNTEEFINYCKNDFKPVHTCDPTVFIDINNVHKIAGDWKKRISNKYRLDFNKPIIVSMLQNENLSKIVYERYSSKYQIVTLFKYNKYADYFLYDLNPFEWAAFLSVAKIVFTQYFHGALLTLKNNCPVIVFDMSNYNDCYESKFKDLMLRRLKLPELYYDICELDNDQKINEMLGIAKRAINGSFNERIKMGLQKEEKCLYTFIDHLKKLY